MKFDEKLNISQLVKCAENFNETLVKAKTIEEKISTIDELNESDPNYWYPFARSAVIQVFEMTVEQSWKMMQRWVKINADNKIHEKPKRELFRAAHQSGLISDPIKWWEFYEGRNKTSHAYQEEIAEEVYSLARKFAPYLSDFLKNLEARI